MKNQDIKRYAKTKGVKLYQIADELCITDSTFSKKLRYEFTDNQKQEIFAIIDKLTIINKTANKVK